MPRDKGKVRCVNVISSLFTYRLSLQGRAMDTDRTHFARDPRQPPMYSAAGGLPPLSPSHSRVSFSCAASENCFAYILSPTTIRPPAGLEVLPRLSVQIPLYFFLTNFSGSEWHSTSLLYLPRIQISPLLSREEFRNDMVELRKLVEDALLGGATPSSSRGRDTGGTTNNAQPQEHHGGESLRRKKRRKKIEKKVARQRGEDYDGDVDGGEDEADEELGDDDDLRRLRVCV